MGRVQGGARAAFATPSLGPARKASRFYFFEKSPCGNYSTQMSLGNFPISRKSSLPLVAEFMLTRRAKGLPARSMTISSSLSATWFKSVPKFWRISIAETTFDMVCPSVTPVSIPGSVITQINLIIIMLNVKKINRFGPYRVAPG